MAIPQPTVQHEGRTYVAPGYSVPMVPYLMPVDPRSQYVGWTGQFNDRFVTHHFRCRHTTMYVPSRE
jgi:hypothetical protein